jgi:hypothetical protein
MANPICEGCEAKAKRSTPLIYKFFFSLSCSLSREKKDPIYKYVFPYPSQPSHYLLFILMKINTYIYIYKYEGVAKGAKGYGKSIE